MLLQPVISRYFIHRIPKDRINVSISYWSDLVKNVPITSGKRTDDMLPFENSQRATRPHKSPHRSGGRIGSLGGKNFNSSQAAQAGEFYCPIEDDYVSEDFCEDQDCEYYDEDWEQEGYDCPCTCDDKEDL